MRLYLYFSLLGFFCFSVGCCKDDSADYATHCKILNASKSPNEITFYNYYKDTLFEINKNKGLYKLKYGKDTLQITEYELFGGISNVIKYYKKNTDLIEYQYSSYLPFIDSGVNKIRIKNDLIVSDIIKNNDSITYLYNLDNTILETNAFGTKTKFEYYDIIDNIDVSNNLVLLTNYFKLKTVFKLLKQKSVTRNGVTTITDYQYQFDTKNKVTKCIINNKDTVTYSYLCN